MSCRAPGPGSARGLLRGPWVRAEGSGFGTANEVVVPTVLSTADRKGPRPWFCFGALWPTVGNTVGISAPFSVHILFSREERQRLAIGVLRWSPAGAHAVLCEVPEFGVRRQGLGGYYPV